MSHSKIFKKSLLALSIATLTGSILVGCGGSSSDSDDVSGTDYNGPGSKWDLSMKDDGTFHIDHRPDINSAIDYTVDGTYTRHNSGFVSLTVTGGEGVDAPSVGSEAWALEVPGYAFMLKPVDSDQLVAMVKAGECPTGDLDANWVIVKQDTSGGHADANNSGRDFAGTFHFDASTQTPSLPAKKALSAGYPDVAGGGIDPGAVTCSDGIMNVPGAAMYLTSNGGAIVHTDSGTPSDETDDSFIFGLGQKAITHINDADGDYAGMLFDDNMGNGNKIHPVSLSCVSGSCTGYLVTDISTGAVSTDSVTVTLTAINEIGGDVLNGFMTGTIDDGFGTGNMICMADPDALGTGKKIVSCVGQSPGDVNDMFNVLFVSK